MSRLPYFLVAGSLALLVACEPLPPNPPPGHRPIPPRIPPNGQGPGFGPGQGQPFPGGDQGYQDGGDGYDQPGGGIDRPPVQNDYPVAQKTANPNQVLSPYAPYNVIDVEGFRSGQLARDPSNGKIFRVP